MPTSSLLSESLMSAEEMDVKMPAHKSRAEDENKTNLQTTQ